MTKAERREAEREMKKVEREMKERLEGAEAQAALLLSATIQLKEAVDRAIASHGGTGPRIGPKRAAADLGGPSGIPAALRAVGK